MKFSKTQLVLVLIAIASLVMGIRTMLQMQTVILTPLGLVYIYIPIVFIVSFGLGALIKYISKGRLTLLSATCSLIIILCSSFIYSEYKPSHEIMIPDAYSGDVMLFLSNEENDFKINEYGIGYISSKSFTGGFIPKINRNGVDITKEIKGYSVGTFASTSLSGRTLGPYQYVQFTIPGNVTNQVSDLEKLIELKALDTARVAVNPNQE